MYMANSDGAEDGADHRRSKRLHIGGRFFLQKPKNAALPPQLAIVRLNKTGGILGGNLKITDKIVT